LVNYLKLRPNNLTSPEFKHLWLLMFWAVFGAAFSLLERLTPREDCAPVWCPLDDIIPFCEWFLIPYIFWFVFLIGMHGYLLLFDIRAFRRFMYFIIFTYGTTIVIYMLWPTCQLLRPTEFARDNVLTRLMADYYAFDTNTNVCPSLHVVGSLAVAFGAWDSKHFRTLAWRVVFTAVALLIAISTVFVKQHSILDVFWGLLLCAVGYILVYKLPQWIPGWKERWV